MSDEVPLIEAPDLRAVLRTRWPRLALRAGFALVLPPALAAMAGALGFYGPVEALGLPLDFLDVGPFPYAAKVVAAAVLVALLVAYGLPKRTHAIVLGVSSAGVLWLGSLYSRLAWARLFAPAFDPVIRNAPSAAAILYGGGTLLAGCLFVLLDNALAAAEAQRAREIPQEEARAAFAASAAGVGVASGAGLALAAVLGWGYSSLSAAHPSLGFRLNPVLVLLGMGIVLAGAVLVAARR